jgi:hypothetical protein
VVLLKEKCCEGVVVKRSTQEEAWVESGRGRDGPRARGGEIGDNCRTTGIIISCIISCKCCFSELKFNLIKSSQIYKLSQFHNIFEDHMR